MVRKLPEQFVIALPSLIEGLILPLVDVIMLFFNLAVLAGGKYFVKNLWFSPSQIVIVSILR